MAKATAKAEATTNTKVKKKFSVNDIRDSLVAWVGTTNSLIAHTAIFALSFLSHWLFGISMDSVLLILTTVVSLEAIYLAIFIQRSVNQQATRLDEVEESLDDVEEALDDVEESLDDVEESLDDVEESIDDVEESLAAKKNLHDHKADEKMRDSIEQIILELKALTEKIDKKK